MGSSSLGKPGSSSGKSTGSDVQAEKINTSIIALRKAPHVFANHCVIDVFMIPILKFTFCVIE
jgi:hypothetical protein